jgi:hypothetical protein
LGHWRVCQAGINEAYRDPWHECGCKSQRIHRAGDLGQASSEIIELVTMRGHLLQLCDAPAAQRLVRNLHPRGSSGRRSRGTIRLPDRQCPPSAWRSSLRPFQSIDEAERSRSRHCSLPSPTRRHVRYRDQTCGIDELGAEHWMARWEREAGRQGLDRFSRNFLAAGRDWIGGAPPEALRSPRRTNRRGRKSAPLWASCAGQRGTLRVVRSFQNCNTPCSC